MPQVNITAIPGRIRGWQNGDRLAGQAQPRVGAIGDFQPIESHGLSQAFIDRFSVFFTRQADGCWLWTAGVDAYGYGQIARANSRGPIKAHRAMWMLVHGPISSAQHVLHKCDVTRCVNPDHLFLGDQATNMKDAAAKGRLHVARPNARTVPDAVVAAIIAAPQGRGVMAQLARQYGVSKCFVGKVRRGVARRAVPSPMPAASSVARASHPRLPPSTVAEGQA